ncbi:Uncharacterised protein [Vibrio cholerae]|nr:Uncharacterised protein [Vibrio cholerae]
MMAWCASTLLSFHALERSDKSASFTAVTISCALLAIAATTSGA